MLPLSRPSLRRQDFDHVLDAMVHDRLASGEISSLLGRETAKALGLKEAAVYASVADGVGRILEGLGLVPGDKVVVSPLAPGYWYRLLRRYGLEPVLADVLEFSPVLDPEAVQAVLSLQPKAVVADTCLGYLPDFRALAALGLIIIEDISQGMGGVFEGRPVGSFGHAVLAHFSPDTLVAGAGGCLVGFRAPPQEAPDSDGWELVTDLAASLILSQWKDTETFVLKKRENFTFLFHRLPRQYRQPKQTGDAQTVGPWFPVLVESGAKEVLAYSRKKAVSAEWAFRDQAHFSSESSVELCPRARRFLFHTLIFPLYATFSTKELELLGKVISSLP